MAAACPLLRTKYGFLFELKFEQSKTEEYKEAKISAQEKQLPICSACAI